MQPDLPSTQREDEQPEALSPQDLTPSEPLSTPEAAPLEPTPVVEAVAPQPALPAEKKHSKLNFAAISLALLAFLLLLGFGWVGYWAYTLNTELTTTQGQLAALQADHAKLQAEYTTLKSENGKLNTDLTQSKTNLEKANTDLAATQADLKKSKDLNKEISAQIEEASGLTEILYVMMISEGETGILKMDRLITEAGNKELTKQWDNFTRSPSEDTYGSFLQYLIFATRESLR
jgi:hypothetical protein